MVKVKKMFNLKTADDYFNSGNELLLKSKIDNAVRCFTEGLSIFPQDDRFFTSLGTCFFIQNKIDLAIFNYKKALSLTTSNLMNRLVLIKTLIFAEKYKEAFFYRHEIKLKFESICPYDLEVANELKMQYEDFDRLFKEKNIV